MSEQTQDIELSSAETVDPMPAFDFESEAGGVASRVMVDVDDGFEIDEDPGGVAPVWPGAAEAPPERVGPYRLLRNFDAGQAARVFLAERAAGLGMCSPAVVKWVPAGARDFVAARDSLLDEATALAALAHPNIVRFIDAAEDAHGVYLVIEHVAGSDLKTIMVKLFRDRRRLSVPMVCYVMSKVLHGLHAAHSAADPKGRSLGIIHRDITPSNILISYHGEVKIADFGIVRMTKRAQAATLPGVVKGKFRYMAPEYVDGQQLNPRTDIYAAGVTLFELLAGMAAFGGKNQVQVFQAIMSQGLPLQALRDRRVPDPLIEAVQRATNRDPKLRYPTAAHMAFALEGWLGSSETYLSTSVVAHTLRQSGLLLDGGPVA